MSNHPIIKALQEELKKERNKNAEFQGNGHAIPVVRSMYPSKSRGEMAREFAQLYSLGHEAASARLLGLLEKAVEMAEFYANATEISLGKKYQEPTCDGVPFTKLAKQFLTTLADAFGEKDGE